MRRLPLVVSTFHALGVRLLRADGERIGLKPKFSILDANDVLGVLKDAGTTTDNAQARRWQWAISLWKNQGLSSDEAEAAAQGEDERSAARVMRRYEERLAAYQAVDFDDLIGLSLKLLVRDAETRAKWQSTLRYLLVDEVQDTNATQYEMLRLLADPQAPRFTAVGDDDQSIYGWRGATIENLKRLTVDYPALKGHRARAELPLDGCHPARGQRRHRQQPQALREEAVERVRRRRAGRAARVRRRGARGRARRGARPGAPGGRR
ncbi:MAG: UvrD-helicase domain-containing protein [Ideonella sp.]|nr:UvrD-helicase domain-containing protein [Ideonella sp.]